MKMASETTQNRGAVAIHSIRIIGLLWALLSSANGFFVDYAENTELIQQSSGFNITLLCSLKGLINESKAADIKYFWYFKQCGESSGGSTNCYDSNNDDEWTQLPCEDNFCRAELQLRNVTEKYSGLYKCTVVPTKATSLDIRLVRTFQLDITNTSQKIPEFLDAFPLNRAVSLGAQAVFQCRVYSEDYATVKWFRRLPILKSGNYENLHLIVYYSGRAYELLTTPREKPVGRDVYLSKLILNEVRPQDEGFYACVAISVRGHIIREAYLQIHTAEDQSSSDYWQDYSEENDDRIPTDPKKFWLLFLMPVGLALLPISVWLCYIAHKRCRRLKDQAKISEEKLASTDEQRMLRTYIKSKARQDKLATMEK